MTDPEIQPAGRGIADLLGDATQHLSTLVRKEFDLLRAEMSEKAGELSSSAMMLGVGAIMALVALNVLAIAAVIGLTESGLEPGWAALIVGGAVALLAVVLIGIGMSGLKAKNLVPRRTARSLEKDATTIGRAAR